LLDLTPPKRTRHVSHKPWFALRRHAELSEWHFPYTLAWLCPPPLQDSNTPPPPVAQGIASEPNGLLLPPVHDPTTSVEDLMYQCTKATHIASKWESTNWYADATAACALREVLPPVSNGQESDTNWALVAFRFEKKRTKLQKQNLFVDKTATHRLAR